MATKFNPTQELAIEAKNDNILISAGAGSGKSTVLIERLMRKIIAQEAHIDEFLIVTFTNLASKEMLEKLRKALNKKLAETTDPTLKTHLEDQVYKLPYANISTFHGFCTKVINTYYYLAGLDATTNIIDDLESTLLLSESLENFMDNHYDQVDFKFLSDVFGTDRSDAKFKALFTILYKKTIEKPDIEEWLSSLVGLYQMGEKIEDWAYYQEMRLLIKEMLALAKGQLGQAREMAEKSYREHAYLDKFSQDVAAIDEIGNKESYEGIRLMLGVFDFGKFPARNTKIAKEYWEETAHKIAKDEWEKAKKTIETIRDKYFAYTVKSHQIHFEHGLQVIQILKKYLIKFHEQFTDEKRQLSKVDFSDLEHLTLRILTENQDILVEIASGFREIMIDEYQDTNPMQEVIVRLLADSLTPQIPVFMVGDIKQAIYRFRGADPSIFKQKYDTFFKKNVSLNSQNCKIDLMKNYRSSKQVIDATNHIFRNLMNETVGKIHYNEDAELELGKIGDDDHKINQPCLYILNEAEISEDINDPELKKAKIEAHFIGNKICTMLEDEQLIWDNESKALRLLRPSDITILLRSMTNAEIFYKILNETYNIPVDIETAGNLLKEIEILTIRSTLQTIDNPYQDIPLVATLRSPIFGFTEQDLSQIRIHQRSEYFYQSLKIYNKTGNDEVLKAKVTTFLTRLNKWRLSANLITIPDLLQTIYEETGYYYFVLGLSAGITKQANLDLFVQIAHDYQQQTTRGLYPFLRRLDYLDFLEKEIPSAKIANTTPGLKIMTIHKSKGLEFPLVFLASLDRAFDRRDESGDCIIHKDYGLGLRYIDPMLRLKQKTLPARLIAAKIHEEMLAEEMRLLYVALTRAESKLILTGVVKGAKVIEKLKATDFTADIAKRSATSYMDWVLPIVIHSEDERNNWDVKIISDVDIKGITFMKRIVEEKAPIEIDFQKAFAITYNRAELTEIIAKQSVTQRKIEETVPLYKGIAELIEAPVYDRPSFIQNGVKATEVGTAFHQFMQHLSIETGHTFETLVNLRLELVETNIIQEKLAESVNLKNVCDFTKSDLYQQLLKARVIRKELPFTMLIDVGKSEESKAMLQGIVDLLAEFEDEVWIVDYKTDRVQNFAVQQTELRRRYDVQMKYYLQAMKGIYPGKAVVAKVYFMNAGQFIEYV